jgi:plastocyanin
MIAIRTRTSRVALAACAALALACSSDVSAPQVPNGDSLYWALTLNHHAVALSTVAPWDTVRLVATPRNAEGAALAGLPEVTFRTSDTGTVSVSQDGLLTALATATDVRVIASLTVGGLTLEDTAVIEVTDAAPPPAPLTYAIQLSVGDSAVLPVASAFAGTGTKLLGIAATDGTGAPVAGIPVYFTSSDPTIATVDRSAGLVVAVRPGRVTIHAVSTAYGVSMSDSLALTITPPSSRIVYVFPRTPVGSTTPVSSFDPGEVTLAAGGEIFWQNDSGQAVDIVFDDPSQVREASELPDGSGGGNITNLPGDSTALANGLIYAGRSFPIPGAYSYHSERYGTSGKIVVQ